MTACNIHMQVIRKVGNSNASKIRRVRIVHYPESWLNPLKRIGKDKPTSALGDTVLSD